MKLQIDKIILWLAVVLPCFLLGGCYKEDTSECPNGFEISFRYIAKNGVDMFSAEVESITLMAFDNNGILVGRWEENDNSKFDASYKMKLDLPVGQYTFVAWGGLRAGDYSLYENDIAQEPVIGQTHIDDLLLRIDNNSNVVDTRQMALFHGKLSPSGLTGSKGVTRGRIDLMKFTKTIKVTIEGVSLTGSVNSYDNLQIYFESPNGGYDFLGNLEAGQPLITYLPQGLAADDDVTISFDLYVMPLIFGNGNRLVIKDTDTNTLIFDYDLLEDFIRKIPAYSTQSGVNAEDIFEIRIENSVSATVTINGWELSGSGSEIQ